MSEISNVPDRIDLTDFDLYPPDNTGYPNYGQPNYTDQNQGGGEGDGQDEGYEGSSFPSFATLAYYQALSRDEQQYGAEAEYRQQFYNFIDQLSNQIYNAIANGQSTISRGDKYQPYPDDPTLAASVDGFFNAIFGSDGEADVYEVVNSDLYSEAVSEYNAAPYAYDFAAGWSTIDSPSALVENAETANQERLDDIAAQEEADRIAEEERIAQEEAAARQAALDNADSIFRAAGYNPTATEVATFADNPDGIADYVDPRQVTAEEARQLWNDAGIPDSVLDGEFAEMWTGLIDRSTGQGDENFQSTVNTNIGYFADSRIVTEAEAREYFESLGYEPSPEEIADFVGVIDNPMRTDNYDTRREVGDYVDPRQITEAEARGYFEDLGYEPSPEEIQDFMGQGGADFESTRSGELGTYVDEHQVTRAELEQIAAEQGYELDPDDDYGQYIRQGADVDQADIKATAEQEFDEGATSVEEVQEIYRRRAGVDISNAEAQALLDLAILEGDGSPNLSEEGFGGWATENIEVDLRQHLENLGNGVLNILFGSTDVEEILQQQMETLLPPSPSEENYEEKYNEWLKRQGDAVISINNSPATSGTWAGVRFPVPIPVSGPEIRIPIFDAEGNYQGPSSVGELLVGENGVVTQVIDGIETQIGEIKETGIEIFGEDGQGGVLGQIIDLGQATIDTVTGQATFTPENPDIQFNEETGQIIQPETEDNTGLPLDEKEDEEEPPDAEDIEEDAYDGVFNNDVDGDGIPNDQDEFPNDPNNGVDPDAPDEDPDDTDEDPDGTGEVDPVDPDGTDEGTTDTSDDIPEGDRVAYLSDVEAAKEEVLNTLGDQLEALGLDVDEVKNILDGVQEQLDGVVTSGDLDELRSSLEQTISDELGELGIDDIQGTLDAVNEDLDGLNTSLNDLSRAVGLPAREDDPNTEEDESRPATGIYAAIEEGDAATKEYIDGLVEDIEALGVDVANIPGLIEGIIESTSAELEALGLSQEEIINLLGSPATDDTEATGLYATIDDLSTQIDTTRTDLNARIDDLIEDGLSRADAVDQALADLAEANNTSTEAILERIGTTEEELTGQISDLSDRVGAPAEYDDEGNLVSEASGLYAEIDALVADGVAREEAVNQVLSDLADQYDTNTETILEQIGTTEEALKEDIAGVASDVADIAAAQDTITADISDLTDLVMAYEADGIARDEAITLAVNDLSENLGLTRDELLLQIGTSEANIMDAIDASQMETDQYLDYISSVIGRPASELTQDDVDMVVDLLAEDEFISDFNNDLRLYDVNFDGQIDQSDIGLLQGFVDAGVEGIGEIPATGIYADAARRQDEITGSIADQAGETRELIGDEAAETRRLMGQQNLFNALLGSGDLMGRQVDVKTPDPVQLKYIYDFSDIFATPQQRGLFPSPYGAPQRQAAQQVAQQRGIMSGPLNLGGLQGRPGMAAGGKVDYDFTDEIMHIMSYGDS